MWWRPGDGDDAGDVDFLCDFTTQSGARSFRWLTERDLSALLLIDTARVLAHPTWSFPGWASVQAALNFLFEAVRGGGAHAAPIAAFLRSAGCAQVPEVGATVDPVVIDVQLDAAIDGGDGAAQVRTFHCGKCGMKLGLDAEGVRRVQQSAAVHVRAAAPHLGLGRAIGRGGRGRGERRCRGR